jgi:hypothetical protein
MSHGEPTQSCGAADPFVVVLVFGGLILIFAALPWSAKR